MLLFKNLMTFLQAFYAQSLRYFFDFKHTVLQNYYNFIPEIALTRITLIGNVIVISSKIHKNHGKLEWALKSDQVQVGIYFFKLNNGNTRTTCETCLKLIITTSERQWRHSGVIIVNFEPISHIHTFQAVFPLLTLRK